MSRSTASVDPSPPPSAGCIVTIKKWRTAAIAWQEYSLPKNKLLSVTSSSSLVTMRRRGGAFCLRVVDDTLKKLFFKLGDLVGRQPGYFLIVPALLTALCASGFQRMDYNYDPEYLISPTSGPAKTERALMEKYFPVDYQQFQVWTVFLIQFRKNYNEILNTRNAWRCHGSESCTLGKLLEKYVFNWVFQHLFTLIFI